MRACLLDAKRRSGNGESFPESRRNPASPTHDAHAGDAGFLAARDNRSVSR